MKIENIMEAPQSDLKLTFQTKPNDPAMALVYLDTTKIPMGEMSREDFKDEEERAKVEAFLEKELARIAKKLTKMRKY